MYAVPVCRGNLSFINRLTLHLSGFVWSWVVLPNMQLKFACFQALKCWSFSSFWKFLFAWQWKMWFSAFLNSEHSQTFDRLRYASLSPWVIVLFYDTVVFSGTLVECKAACAFSIYPHTPKIYRFSLWFILFCHLSLLLLTVALVLTCPFLQIIGAPDMLGHGKTDDPHTSSPHPHQIYV